MELFHTYADRLSYSSLERTLLCMWGSSRQTNQGYFLRIALMSIALSISRFKASQITKNTHRYLDISNSVHTNLKISFDCTLSNTQCNMTAHDCIPHLPTVENCPINILAYTR